MVKCGIFGILAGSKDQYSKRIGSKRVAGCIIVPNATGKTVVININKYNTETNENGITVVID